MGAVLTVLATAVGLGILGVRELVGHPLRGEPGYIVWLRLGA